MYRHSATGTLSIKDPFSNGCKVTMPLPASPARPNTLTAPVTEPPAVMICCTRSAAGMLL